MALNSPGVGGVGGIGSTGPNGDAGANGSAFDVFGNFKSMRFNLIGIGEGGSGFTSGVRNDQIGSLASPIDPLLGPLQMNGGPTPTHALMVGSPAIDQGNCFGKHEDQRGHRRPERFSTLTHSPGGDGSDIGAFELDATRSPAVGN
jgi:hypothetical protein